MNFWFTQNEDFQTMDKNSGLPPEQWIKQVKMAVKSVYSQLSSKLKILTFQQNNTYVYCQVKC